MTQFTQGLHQDADGLRTAARYNSAAKDWESPVTTIQKKWRDDFTGAALDPAKWTVIQTGAGQAISIANDNLTITTGTTPGAETIIESVATFSIPFRLQVGWYQTQKLANQETVFEIVSVDPNTGIADGKFAAAWSINGSDNTSVTNAVYEVLGGGVARLRSVSSSVVQVTSATYNVLEIEPTDDECWFHSKSLDSPNGRSNSYKRDQRLPDPNAMYKVRIRTKNGPVAPSSSTTVNIEYVLVTDNTEITAEITAGRGGVAAGQAAPVYVANSPSISGTPTVQGATAHDNVVSGNPVLTGGYAHATGQAAVSADGDVARFWVDRRGALAVWNPPVGAQANAWNGAVVAAGGNSAAVDLLYCTVCTIFGNVSAATNLTVQVSQDNVNWYNSDIVLNLAVAGNFYRNFDCGARYLRLLSSAAATITATIAGKS